MEELNRLIDEYANAYDLLQYSLTELGLAPVSPATQSLIANVTLTALNLAEYVSMNSEHLAWKGESNEANEQRIAYFEWLANRDAFLG